MSDSTTIYLVRHPETELNADGRCQGRGDAPFTAAGTIQLQRLVESLTGVAFDAAYTSPLLRTRRTAEAILAGRGLRAAAVAELAELDYGDLQGTRFTEWPEGLHDRWRVDPWSVAFPGGESLAALRARVVPTFRRIVSAHAGETILVSSHGHVNRILLMDLDQSPASRFWEIEQSNGSVSVLNVPSAPVPSEVAR